MKTRKFNVVVTEDYSSNMGEPEAYTMTYDSLQKASIAYDKEIDIEYTVNGKFCRVELIEVELDADGEDIPIKTIREELKKSALLPATGVVVTYQHHRYMDYAYNISEVRYATPGEKYEDLNVSVDYVGSDWDVVYDSIEELIEDYERGYSAPMDKINAGSTIIDKFLSDNGIAGYVEDEE